MSADKDDSLLWNSILHSLQEEIDPDSFDIWFSMLKFDSFKNNILTITAPNHLTCEWIESRYAETIKSVLQKLSDNSAAVEIKSRDQISKELPCSTNLNPRYTFDSFVIGNSNRFAHAACYAVGEAPSRAYNPLFIYGGVGLGKTHLMQAIGSSILNKSQNYSVVYVSSEQFTNELISSIKDDNTSEFRNRYRNVDVLLIDDIQFLAGKERTQEEFFHTFNTLHEANKQVVISSDRPPKSILTLEDRLISRFEWGLITDIQPPDFETRVAILRKKAHSENMNVPYDVLDYIANYIDSNIRELEGALIRLVAYANVTHMELNINTAVKALKDILPAPRPHKITIESIQKAVASYYNINVKELLSKKRNKPVVYPRQMAMYLCRTLTDASYPQIGHQFGGRDHSTVMHSIEKIENMLADDQELNDVLEKLKKKIDPNYIK
ncbi:MAG: chromosomal replication initiator protein DnaA [Syntrophomonadaceae bacterium]|jgi:chromosomal replication initiator protein|nr:chromosomal replication initiator protein DnaA [Syntrophomonadaceae bacterium]